MLSFPYFLKWLSDLRFPKRYKDRANELLDRNMAAPMDRRDVCLYKQGAKQNRRIEWHEPARVMLEAYHENTSVDAFIQ
jgi:hypothetical protein